jgi:hypothetical protein
VAAGVELVVEADFLTLEEGEAAGVGGADVAGSGAEVRRVVHHAAEEAVGMGTVAERVAAVAHRAAQGLAGERGGVGVGAVRRGGGGRGRLRADIERLFRFLVSGRGGLLPAVVVGGRWVGAGGLAVFVARVALNGRRVDAEGLSVCSQL